MSEPILSLEAVTLTYRAADHPDRTVLREVSLDVAPGEAVALVGRSGSGKSSLLHLAAGIAVPTAGRVRLAGHDLGTASERERTLRRREAVGLVFQFFHLLPHLSVAENVALPGWIGGLASGEVNARALDLLQQVGLGDRAHDPVGRLSGGEMQRVALCRALLRRPPLVLADEPTGSLDDRTGREVMDLLLRLTRTEGGALLYVTHSRELAAAADRTLRLVDGRMVAEPAA
ncbi:MAG TPA: ABC transporter ATP-binding protein [Candidatus Krumholzibacteria bacterium]|nr:ABC transporter ATP-binding protein [Candidatus Krumholzibacteria bacterium]